MISKLVRSMRGKNIALFFSNKTCTQIKKKKVEQCGVQLSRNLRWTQNINLTKHKNVTEKSYIYTGRQQEETKKTKAKHPGTIKPRLNKVTGTN